MADPIHLSPDDLASAHGILARSRDARGYLVLLGDKSLLFDDARTAFVMYARHWRTWIAMGDPIGNPDAGRALVRAFIERAAGQGGHAAFYEVSADWCPVYVDAGLSLEKLGESAAVDLAAFSLAGARRKGLRSLHNHVAKHGCTFEILEDDAVHRLLPELRAVSDAWLMHKHTREKGFSLGFFDERYLVQCPVAVVRREARVVAFSNVWVSSDHEEVSIDLMRHVSDAPNGVMDYLFAELFLWGKAQGFRWFDLGMAPLSGMREHERAPFWSKVGDLVYRHGEHFYNFQGLRAFKEKFGPVWKPRYLASAGGLAVPLVLASAAALVSRGFTGAVSR